jgi:DUF1365 family protein
MNSVLYKCNVMHHRLEPKKHSFNYDVFMFYIDLEEIDMLTKKLWLFSKNAFNAFSFHDKDHLGVNKENANDAISSKLKSFVSSNGINLGEGRIMLLSNLRTMGYVFNPVSFYFCFNLKNELECAVVEVCNTFREIKLYFIGKENIKENTCRLSTKKHFYVSPFIDLDTTFDFNLEIPDRELKIHIDDYKEGKRFFLSALTGVQDRLTNLNLLWYTLRFPLITLQIIALIHWHALRLWFKKIPYHKKNANLELQKNVLKPYKI